MLKLIDRIYSLTIEPVRNKIIKEYNINFFYKWCCIKFGDWNKVITTQQKLKKIR